LIRLVAQVEAGLREISFDEVTLDDRAIFVEQAVVWQIRTALQTQRFDLALELQRYAVRRIAEIHASARTPSRAWSRLTVVRGGPRPISEYGR
jgi:hypothetical protein